ncbi:hypothetical protein PAXY110619_29730 [Paenibacillus xylanexedens]|uniref:Uncharacterized protein n=1 Tax=Paenibacillus xylanexedens TaxID=528191 RepID=A0ABS4S279_PAEXY|nr:hypothetical protein [Paenibacillus xylanexedens]
MPDIYPDFYLTLYEKTFYLLINVYYSVNENSRSQIIERESDIVLLSLILILMKSQ